MGPGRPGRTRMDVPGDTYWASCLCCSGISRPQIHLLQARYLLRFHVHRRLAAIDAILRSNLHVYRAHTGAVAQPPIAPWMVLFPGAPCGAVVAQAHELSAALWID